MLLEQIRSEIVQCMKTGDKAGTGHRKVILGEIQRLPKKDPSDDDVVRLLKKLEASTESLLEYSSRSPATLIEDREFLDILRTYIPALASGDEIKEWITENVDFSSLKNPMQAVGLVIKHFGSQADGNVVKAIIQDMGH